MGKKRDVLRGIKGFDPKPFGTFFVDETEFKVQSAGKNYSLRKVNDNTLRFEVREGDPVFDVDVTKGVDRSEISCMEKVKAESLVQVKYDLLIEPGEVTTPSWCCIGQWHATDKEGQGASPPVAFRLGPGDIPYVEFREGEWNDHRTIIPWRGPKLIRGQWYKVRFKTRFTSKGLCQFWFNDRLLVNYYGQLGYRAENRNYWKIGVYRGSAQETLAIRVKDMRHRVFD
jgi:hypothetical protein